MPEKGDEKRKRCQVTEMSREKKRSRDSDGLDKKKGHVQRMRIQQTEMSLERTGIRRRCQEKEMSRKRDEKRQN